MTGKNITETAMWDVRDHTKMFKDLEFMDFRVDNAGYTQYRGHIIDPREGRILEADFDCDERTFGRLLAQTGLLKAVYINAKAKVVCPEYGETKIVLTINGNNYDVPLNHYQQNMIEDEIMILYHKLKGHPLFDNSEKERIPKDEIER